MSSPTSTACSSCWQGRSDEGMAQGLQALTSFEAVALMSPAAPAPPGGTYASRPPQQRRVPRRGPVDPEPVLHHPPPGLAERAARREVEQAFADAPCAVRFLGALPPGALIEPYAASDLLVWPAINEAFGMALLEAQACGLPVLAGASGGVPAIVADGKTGFLVPPGDATAFAAALKAALKSDLPALGAAARAKVAKRHDLPAASANLARVLARLGVKP